MPASDPNETHPRSGRIVGAFGRHAIVEDANHRRHRCTMQGKRLRPVCADDVEWYPQRTDGGEGIVASILPRRAELARPDRRGRREVVASNMTQIVVVLAPSPEPDFSLADRYLVSVELAGIAGAVVANKSDIADLPLQEFADIGYRTVTVCAKKPDTLPALADLLAGHTSILVGQSGVGKSSLLNALIPGLDARTRTLSAASGEGRHTTSAAALHHLDNGGEVIDSPGVRDHAPPPLPGRELASGFVEFFEPAQTCRFANCLHLAEPDCAVKDAVASGQIATRRYESYRELVERMTQLDADQY